MNLKKSFIMVAVSILAMIGTQVQAQDTAADRNTVTVPTGTKISVRNDEAIDSQNASEGKSYSATVIQAVEGGAGEVLIPKESPAELVIVQTSTGGTTGSPRLVLDLKSITVNGHRYHLSTEDVSQSGKQGI